MFAEDPGAANFIVPLAAALYEDSIDSIVFSAGKADQIFKQFHISHRIIGGKESAQKLIDSIKLF